MSYLKDNREKFFPWIKDFSDPQNELRNRSPKDQTRLEWFWFSPFAYFYFIFLIPIMLLTCSVIAIPIFIYFRFYFFAILVLIGVIVIIMHLKKTWRIRTEIKDKSFYDIFIRD